MVSMSGNAKLRRAANQLENAQRLILSLPRQFYKDPERKASFEKLAKDIFIVKQGIENIEIEIMAMYILVSRK
jgi:hypothetical protein